jgi:hypothetical protein
MIRLHTLTEGIAVRLLARKGIATIWELQVAAAIAHRTGNLSAAASIVEIAEAAEREWLRSEHPPTLCSTHEH